MHRIRTQPSAHCASWGIWNARQMQTSVRTNRKPNSCSIASFWRSFELPPKVENPRMRYSLRWLRIFYTRTLTRKRHCGNTPPPIRRVWTRYWCRKWSGLTGEREVVRSSLINIQKAVKVIETSDKLNSYFIELLFEVLTKREVESLLLYSL